MIFGIVLIAWLWFLAGVLRCHHAVRSLVTPKPKPILVRLPEGMYTRRIFSNDEMQQRVFLSQQKRAK